MNAFFHYYFSLKGNSNVYSLREKNPNELNLQISRQQYSQALWDFRRDIYTWFQNSVIYVLISQHKLEGHLQLQSLIMSFMFMFSDFQMQLFVIVLVLCVGAALSRPDDLKGVLSHPHSPPPHASVAGLDSPSRNEDKHFGYILPNTDTAPLFVSLDLPSRESPVTYPDLYASGGGPEPVFDILPATCTPVTAVHTVHTTDVRTITAQQTITRTDVHTVSYHLLLELCNHSCMILGPCSQK